MTPPVELQAAILGLVQGLCEFFPISSSAHLVVIPEILGWPYLGKSFDVALHVGTLLGLVAYYRKELHALGRAAQRLIFRRGQAHGDQEARLAQFLIVASIPAAVAGFLLDGIVEGHLQGLAVIGVVSILWGLLMGEADRRAHKNRDLSTLSFSKALAIGCAQASALIPGTSRSGATISAGLLCGLSRSEAARFSMLLSIPVVTGATLFKGWSMLTSTRCDSDLSVIILGVAASAVAGGFCLPRFLAYLDRGDLRPFVAYRVVFGIAVLCWNLALST